MLGDTHCKILLIIFICFFFLFLQTVTVCFWVLQYFFGFLLLFCCCLVTIDLTHWYKFLRMDYYVCVFIFAIKNNWNNLFFLKSIEKSPKWLLLVYIFWSLFFFVFLLFLSPCCWCVYRKIHIAHLYPLYSG